MPKNYPLPMERCYLLMDGVVGTYQGNPHLPRSWGVKLKDSGNKIVLGTNRQSDILKRSENEASAHIVSVLVEPHPRLQELHEMSEIDVLVQYKDVAANWTIEEVDEWDLQSFFVSGMGLCLRTGRLGRLGDGIRDEIQKLCDDEETVAEVEFAICVGLWIRTWRSGKV